VDLAADDGTARHDRLERSRDEFAGGREHDRGVQRLGRWLCRRTGPLRAEPGRERLRVGVAFPREREDPTALRTSDLRQDVCRPAEPVDAHPLGFTGHPEAAVADQACAQQRGGLQVRVSSRDREAVPCVGDGPRGETTRDVETSESGVRA
jgi:hypothetical protein